MKYDFTLNLETRNTLSLIINRIKPNSLVLEFGPAHGRLTKYLNETMNCKVYTVELDEKAAKDASLYSQEIIIGDIENYIWLERYQNIQFDYIIFADVLEHLYKPEDVLTKAKTLLKNNGSVLLSLPNIAHNSIIINLLNDNFTYNETGLLDNTHIRFFTKKTIDHFIKNCGLEIAYETGVYILPEETEFKNSYYQCSHKIAPGLYEHEFGEVYQFIIEAKQKVDTPLIKFERATKSLLFFDTGKSFNSQEVVETTFLIQKDKKIEFYLEQSIDNVNAIRIDPLEYASKIKITKFLINNKEIKINDLSHNGINIQNNEFIFLHNDPQFIVNMNTPQQIQSVIIYFDFIEDILDINTLKLLYKDKQIEEKEKEIHHLENLIPSIRLKRYLKRIIPNKTREILHIVKHTLKHPVKLFKAMDRQYANKLIKHIKEGNFSYILERMGHYISHEPSSIHLDLMTKYDTEEVLTFPSSSTPQVSIVIPVYNQFDFTHRCLRSILQFTDNIDYEIIIADDVSNDRTQNIHKYIKNIKIVRNEKNLGFLLNCNNATREAKGDYIVFLNNDTNVQKNWLSTLLETIENDSTIGMVGSKLVYPDGRLQEAGGIIWNDASGWNYGRLDNPEKPEYTYVKEVDYISGAAIMIRTELWKEIGEFDERYVPAYYEDSDLAFEVRKHGYKVVMQPQSIVVHFEGISNGTDTNSGMKKYQIVNHEKFYKKWKNVLEKEHFPNAQDVFLARDRSHKKPHVLFVDHYLPHYDQDAGSKAALQYLQILTNAGMQVHFIGDNFWHYPGTPYLETLTQMGIEVLHGNKYAEHWKEWIKENGKYLKYVILSRPHISVKYIDIIREFSSAKIIYFGHDLHFLREEREYEIKKDKTYLKSSQYWKKLELELIEKSDVSYYFSDVEQSVIKTYNSNLNVNVVPLYIYDNFKESNYRAKERKDIMFVGGFRHPANTDAMIWFVNEVWPTVQQKLSDVHFYIIGSNPPAEVLDMANEHITVTGFISDEALEVYYEKCKLVVAPLRFGAGVKGKVIDAMYNTLPLVTTSIGAEGIQNASEFMKIADDTEAFIDTIISLYNDDKQLESLSKASLKHCKMYFSEHYARQQMANIITEFKE